MSRKHIVVTAHEFSPSSGSECSSGWNIINLLGASNDVTVLYAETNQFNTKNYKKEIENYFKHNSDYPGLKYISVPQPLQTKILVFFNKLISNKKSSVGSSILYFWGVKFWEKKVYGIVKGIIRDQKIDLIHHFNHLSFREPGYLYQFDIPFIWGPTSGLSMVPKSFLRKLSLKERVLNNIRNLMNRFAVKVDSRILKATNLASLIFYVTDFDYAFFSRFTHKIDNLLDMGTYLIEGNMIQGKDFYTQKLKVIWVGRLDRLKALDLLLYAIANSDFLRDKIEVTIIGDGPERDNYQNLAKQLNLNCIKWNGLVPKNSVFDLMKSSHVLVHTSIKEAASAVITEAVSTGLPVVCHDAFGMKYSINETCGIKIPFLTPEESIKGFSSALEILCLDRNLLIELSKGAVNRSDELTWNNISSKISDAYSKILN